MTIPRLNKLACAFLLICLLPYCASAQNAAEEQEMDKRPENLKRITSKKAADKFIKEQIKAIKEQVGDQNVLLDLSCGVDS